MIGRLVDHLPYQEINARSNVLHGHEPWAYPRDTITRLSTQLNNRIEVPLPHNWQRESDAA